MSWVVFSYSLSSKGHSSPRVTIWRRLRRIGAISPSGGLYILPAREECIEALQWLTQEVQQAQGEALMMHVERFEGMSDAHLIELFRAARAAEYTELDAQAATLEERVGTPIVPEARLQLQEALEKLRRRHADIVRVDYFDAPEGTLVASRLARIAQALVPTDAAAIGVSPVSIAAYRDKRWVTRPHPHVDRLACIWLIRRFINPTAVIRYALTAEPGEVAFDMREGEFRHRENLCSFETMVLAFALDNPSLHAIGEIVHEIDLRDGCYARPETTGVDAILKGWLLAQLSDTEREAHGIALFEGLYAAFSRELKQVSGTTQEERT
jgi:hypothetical protein